MQRIATLFDRSDSSSPALAAAYPTSLSAARGEEQVYHPGLFETDTATAVVARGGAGNPVRLKFEGTNDQPDATLIGARDAMVQVVAAARGQSIQLVQARGTSVGTSHSTAASGLTTVTLGTNARGEPAVTANDLATYAAASMVGLFTIAAVGVGTGLMGAMVQSIAVAPAPVWVPIQSTRQDTGVAAAEHVLDPGLGASGNYGFQVQTVGWRALRALARSEGGAPGTGDSIAVRMDVLG